MGAGPAVQAGKAILPLSNRGPDCQGWDFLVRRIEDQRSELNRLEKEIEVVKISHYMMTKLAQERGEELIVV